MLSWQLCHIPLAWQMMWQICWRVTIHVLMTCLERWRCDFCHTDLTRYWAGSLDSWAVSLACTCCNAQLTLLEHAVPSTCSWRFKKENEASCKVRGGPPMPSWIIFYSKFFVLNSLHAGALRFWFGSCLMINGIIWTPYILNKQSITKEKLFHKIIIVYD